jgi:hypothetical protein
MKINPKHLFLIDGIGAILSAISLGVVLVMFDQFFGMPRTTLYVLAIFPCFFAGYDFLCLILKPPGVSNYLKGFAAMNFFYCLLSVGAVWLHHNDLTVYGWIYFIGEVIIVVLLSFVEFRSSKIDGVIS